MLKPYSVLIGLAAICLAIQPVVADEKHTHQHGAHVHGVAQLNVILENNRLDMELITPADNIVGFEHQPRTAEQRQTLATAIAALRAPEQMFSLPPAAGCQPMAIKIETPLLDHDQDAETGADDEHTHTDHTEASAAHAHDTEAHDEDSHAEIHGSYAYECSAPDRLAFIEVLLFQRFPATEAVEVQLVGPQGQTRRELTPNATRLTL